MLDFNTTKAVELFLVSVGNKAKGIEESKRGLSTELVFKALRAVEEVACLVGAKAAAEAVREAITASFIFSLSKFVNCEPICVSGRGLLVSNFGGYLQYPYITDDRILRRRGIKHGGGKKGQHCDGVV